MDDCIGLQQGIHSDPLGSHLVGATAVARIRLILRKMTLTATTSERGTTSKLRDILARKPTATQNGKLTENIGYVTVAVAVDFLTSNFLISGHDSKA